MGIDLVIAAKMDLMGSKIAKSFAKKWPSYYDDFMNTARLTIYNVISGRGADVDDKILGTAIKRQCWRVMWKMVPVIGPKESTRQLKNDYALPEVLEWSHDLDTPCPKHCDSQDLIATIAHDRLDLNIVQLRLEGWSQAEIAIHYNKSQKWVSNKLAEMRKRL